MSVYVGFNNVGMASYLGECDSYDKACEVADEIMGVDWQLVAELGYLEAIVSLLTDPTYAKQSGNWL
ncbi:hypothetical protein N9W09_00485 [Crocinitomicaceae bacterium]|nr:hypothetical protein [Crocinitomicaceae bacterium]